MKKRHPETLVLQPYEFWKAVEHLPVKQQLVLPLPLLNEGDTVFGLMRNELRTPWGIFLASFPVSWRRKCFEKPRVLEPVEITQKQLAKIELKTDDPYLLTKILQKVGLFKTDIDDDFEDVRTPGFVGRVDADCLEGEAKLVFEDTDAPVDDLIWVPRDMRNVCRVAEGTVFAPKDVLERHDVYWR